MPDDQDVQVLVLGTVNHRIGKRFQRENSSIFCIGCAQARLLAQEREGVLKFIQETRCHPNASMLQIEVLCISDVLLSSGMKREIHRVSRARKLAMTSSPGAKGASPASVVASR